MNKIIFLFISMFFMSNTFADNFGCEAFHLNPSNRLDGISVFNARYIGDKYTAELAPTSEYQDSNIITQYWSLDDYKNNKIFVKYIYQNNTYIINQISLSANFCKLRFLDNTKNTHSVQSTDFICF